LFSAAEIPNAILPSGKICFPIFAHLALQLDSEADGQVRENVLNAWKTLFTTMDPDVRFSLVVEKAEEKQHGYPDPEHFNIIQDERWQLKEELKMLKVRKSEKSN
jgi:hypothetical protein